MLGVWVLGGVISLCGALSVAELAAAMPHTGGWYVYLREGWGRLAAFLFGWAQLLLIRASATAAIATVFGEYFLRSLGYDPSGGARAPHYVAAAAIVLCSGFNIRGVRLSAMVTGISTISKFTALTGLVVASYLFGGNVGASTANLAPGGEAVSAGLFGLALISALWAYDGFSDVASVAGEVAEPQRTLPRAIIAGTGAIIAIYLAVNVAYLYVNSSAGVARSPLVAADTMGALFGGVGVALTSIVVTISAFGALNADILLGPRVFFALAQDGLFFRGMTAVHPRYGTPWVAILLTTVLALVFVLTQTFEQLTDTFVLAIWPFYACAIAGLYRLRRTRPDLPRPYRVPGYPFVPAVFVAGVVYLVGNALVTDPLWSSTTFGLVLAGVPVYYLVFGHTARNAPQST
jgi:amino acid transporter